MMNCKVCQAANGEYANFCSNCGNKIEFPKVESGAHKETVSNKPSTPASSKFALGKKLLLVLGTTLAIFAVLLLSRAPANNAQVPDPGTVTPKFQSNEEIRDVDPIAAETVAQENAREKAREYLQVMAFSEKGLIKQLEFEGFSLEDAEYGVKNTRADWNEQAAKKGAEYLKVMAFSANGLMRQLVFDGFTERQAAYAALMNGFR